MYEWECPVCDVSSTCVSHGRGTLVASKPEDAIVTHVRRTSGGGHGEVGELPAGFETEAVAEYVRLREPFGSLPMEAPQHSDQHPLGTH